MAVVKESPVWVTGITQIDPNDPVQGGPGGVDNVPHEQLANRTAYLKKEVEGIVGEPTESVTLESLLRRVKSLETAPDITVPVLPVGATFETTVVYTSGTEVAAAMGYGEWQPFAEGRVTVGVSSKTNDPDWTKVIGTEYGEDEVTLIIDQIPSHDHMADIHKGSIAGNVRAGTDNTSAAEGNIKTSETGGGQSHNNVQRSVVVGKWLRTA